MSVDPLGAVIVIGGTALATFARAGAGDCVNALHQLAMLARPRFDLAANRAQLAGHVARMQRDGVIRSEPIPIDDEELSAANRVLCRFRSVDAMLREHQRHREARELKRQRARGVLEQAAELAPVMGLAGTLVALGRVPGAQLASEADILGAVSTAVISTLAGLLLAHLLLVPLAEAIRRRGAREEELREELAQWLATQLAVACPSPLRQPGRAA